MKQGLKEQKTELRLAMLKQRLSLTEEERREAVARMENRFFSLASFRFAETILLYAPIKGEPDLLSFLPTFHKRGKRIALPLCHPENSTMTYHYVESLGDLSPGTFGVPEPSPDLPVYTPSPDKHDLCIVPAVCFDRQGFRVGYGKGYYDRFLNSFCGTTIGVCYHRFLLPEVPKGRYDRSVDLILTEKGVFPTR